MSKKVPDVSGVCGRVFKPHPRGVRMGPREGAKMPDPDLAEKLSNVAPDWVFAFKFLLSTKITKS